MISHKYRTIDVPVAGGQLRVGIWDPIEVAEGTEVPQVLAIHGITSSHLVWPLLVAQLPGVRVIAPDLRGRGSSRDIAGSGGMLAHSADMVSLLDALGIDSLPVIGHSMGGFVSVVLAHTAPERVSRLVLLDGGLPLDAPADLQPEQLVKAILGSTADRLSMRFDSVAAYLEFWRGHPAFADAWSVELEEYFAYDMVPVGAQLRSATSLQTTTDDTIDMNTGAALPDALAALAAWGKPVLFVSVPLGLANEAPGLYAEDYLARVLPHFSTVRHERLPGLNHYTIVLAEAGAVAVAELLQRELNY